MSSRATRGICFLRSGTTTAGPHHERGESVRPLTPKPRFWVRISARAADATLLGSLKEVHAIVLIANFMRYAVCAHGPAFLFCSAFPNPILRPPTIRHPQRSVHERFA